LESVALSLNKQRQRQGTSKNALRNVTRSNHLFLPVADFVSPNKCNPILSKCFGVCWRSNCSGAMSLR